MAVVCSAAAYLQTEMSGGAYSIVFPNGKKKKPKNFIYLLYKTKCHDAYVWICVLLSDALNCDN